MWDTTRAFGEWRAIDHDSRVFLELTTTVMNERFDALWKEIGERPGDPDGYDEVIDIFDREVKIQPIDYHWMLEAAVVRDAVTAFEVYLEKVGSELGHDWKMKDGKSPFWDSMTKYFATEFGLTIETERTKEIRRLRHILAHQRGELRTKELREKYGTDPAFPRFPSHQAELSPATVTQILDDLGDIVRAVDSAAWTRF
ncbi:hypothetical protein [Nocardia nova]|uniref:hypothetical protein n=1 Tax=Nocardia nova TaxID=37330 RepID=UPI0007A45D17|nr:hypothetical protein [Nocardia nova]